MCTCQLSVLSVDRCRARTDKKLVLIDPIAGPMTHAHTPAIQAFDPRGLVLRNVSYHRRDSTSAPEGYITQQAHDAAGRTVLNCDPRLFLEDMPANQRNVLSLSSALLLSENTDAGWRLRLNAEDGICLEGWDQKRNHSRTRHDALRRPSATYEQSEGEPEYCTERFTYFAGATDDGHNRFGRLIRRDDTAGTLQFSDFTMSGQPLNLHRTFCVDPGWTVNWPESEADRDVFLEECPATTQFSYNPIGELITQTDAMGNQQTLVQDLAGQLKETRLKLATKGANQALVSDIRYNAFGHIEQQRAGNGVVSTATFSLEDGRLQQLMTRAGNGPPLQDLRYDYDAGGNITCILDNADAVIHHRNQRAAAICRYRYDSLSRLIEASGRQIRNAPGGPQLPEFVSPADPSQLENYTRSYTYDPAGNLLLTEHRAASANRTERTVVASACNRSLPEKPDGQLPTEQEIAAAYDANGNRVYLQYGQPLSWDRRNRLQRVDHVIRENETDDIEYYVYDSGGQRQRKVREAYTGAVQRRSETRYLPGLEIRIDPERIVHVMTIMAGRATVQVLHFETDPTHGIPQNQQRYSFTDHLNSSTVELDAQAQIISQESYYPYGGTSWWAGRSQVEANYKTLRYSGQERDASGLYYYGFRYYAPWLQRWLSSDPLGVAEGLNLFAMVRGNPVRFVDRQGLAGVDTASAAGATASREFLSAAVGAAVQAAFVGFLPAASIVVTIGGLVAGGISGGISGYAGTNWAQSSMSVNDPGSWGPLAAKVGGAALGAALGAAPSLLGILDPRGNTAAANQIGSAFGTVFREMSAQYLANVGPSNPSVDRVDLVTGAASVGAAGLAAGATGFGGSVLFGTDVTGNALQSILSVSAVTAASAASASAVRGMRGTPAKPSSNSEPTINMENAVVGYSSRHFFLSLGQIANIAVAQLPGYDALNVHTQTAVSRAVMSAVGDIRSTFVTIAMPGLSAELDRTSWDLEKNETGAGIVRESPPTSSNAGFDPAATEVLNFVSETGRGQRKYSRSGLNF